MITTLTSRAWQLLAQFIARRPGLVERLIQRAQATPYAHIRSQDDKSLYMGRWWLFNAYGKTADGSQAPAPLRWLPSVRIHHILRPDQDRDLHDHPWNARTIVLRGWYVEQRLDEPAHVRQAGYTGRLLFGQYHRIAAVSPGGVWTMFFTWRYRGTWGFLVDGKKVPWREYLGVE